VKTTPRALVAARWQIVGLLPRAGGGLVGALVIGNLVLGLLPVAFVVATSVVLGRVPAAVSGGLHSPAWHSLVLVFVLAAAAFVAQQVVAPFAAALGELAARRVDGKVFDEVMAASLRSRGIAALEDQEVLDELRGAVGALEFGFQSPGQACAGLVTLLARYTQLTGYAIVIWVAFSWLAAAGLVVAVLLFRYGQRGGLRKYVAVRFTLMPGERKRAYLRALAIEAAAGKEIRIFGLVDWLRAAVRQAHLDVLMPVWVERRRVYLWPFIWFAMLGLTVAAVVFGVIGATASHALTLTEFVLVMQASLAAVRLSEYYPEADTGTAVGMKSYEAVSRFSERIEAFIAAEPAAPVFRSPAIVAEPASTIHFDAVTFRYPGQGRAIFEGLDLTIAVGRCTAIVGLNGAGKTTLVKLLARLYEPTSGAVRIDGVDIGRYPIEAWRAKLAVIFQDYVRYEASAADNIAFGAIDALGDLAGIRECAAAVGLDDVLDALPRAIDTPLARHMAGGAELSGGQWQRVALARALFALRHGSTIVVLDEPTASLDVRAEASFFDAFADLTRGATTLLISHRFSTVRRADVIVVLEHGRVAEQGSHDELLALDGRYAELFRLQAERFTEAVFE
jgi:ATP-binding cassette subfamily B protein